MGRYQSRQHYNDYSKNTEAWRPPCPQRSGHQQADCPQTSVAGTSLLLGSKSPPKAAGRPRYFRLGALPLGLQSSQHYEGLWGSTEL